MTKRVDDVSVLRRAEQMLCEAMAFDSEEERNAFIYQAAEGDRALVATVLSLFELEAEADAFFEEGHPVGIPIADVTKTFRTFLPVSRKTRKSFRRMMTWVITSEIIRC